MMRIGAVGIIGSYSCYRVHLALLCRSVRFVSKYVSLYVATMSTRTRRATASLQPTDCTRYMEISRIAFKPLLPFIGDINWGIIRPLFSKYFGKSDGISCSVDCDECDACKVSTTHSSYVCTSNSSRTLLPNRIGRNILKTISPAQRKALGLST